MKKPAKQSNLPAVQKKQFGISPDAIVSAEPPSNQSGTGFRPPPNDRTAREELTQVDQHNPDPYVNTGYAFADKYLASRIDLWSIPVVSWVVLTMLLIGYSYYLKPFPVDDWSTLFWLMKLSAAIVTFILGVIVVWRTLCWLARLALMFIFAKFPKLPR